MTPRVATALLASFVVALAAPTGKYWQLLRPEPGMSACYFGTVEKLEALTRDVLAGKEVEVPTKEPEKPEDVERRREELNDGMKRNRQKR